MLVSELVIAIEPFFTSVVAVAAAAQDWVFVRGIYAQIASVFVGIEAVVPPPGAAESSEGEQRVLAQATVEASIAVLATRVRVVSVAAPGAGEEVVAGDRSILPEASGAQDDAS